MTLNSCVVRGQSGQVWNITCDTNSDFKAYACAFANIRSAVLRGTSVIDGSTFNACGTLDFNGASITDTTFTSPTATQIQAGALSELSGLNNVLFESSGTGHAIEIQGTAGSATLVKLNFTGYAASNGSTGNEAIYVNIASGTVTLTVSGGNSPSIRTAGATVNVVSGATVTFTDLPTGTDIVILTAGTTTILQQIDQNPGTSYAWGYSGTPTVDVGFIKPGYVPRYIRGLALGSSDSSIPIGLTSDRNYL
jgi:hypothetical protein